MKGSALSSVNTTFDARSLTKQKDLNSYSQCTYRVRSKVPKIVRNILLEFCIGGRRGLQDQEICDLRPNGAKHSDLLSETLRSDSFVPQTWESVTPSSLLLCRSRFIGMMIVIFASTKPFAQKLSLSCCCPYMFALFLNLNISKLGR